MATFPALTQMTIDEPRINEITLATLRELVAYADRRGLTDDAVILHHFDADYRIDSLFILGGRPPLEVHPAWRTGS